MSFRRPLRPTRPPPLLWSNLELFSGMSPDDLGVLAEAMQEVTIPAGAEILKEGEVGDEMYVLESGRVQIQVSGDPATGREGFSRSLQAPAIFGEIALITDEPRTATVSASTEIRCRTIGRPVFDGLVKRNPTAAAFLTRAVGERLLEANTIRKVGKYEIVGRLGSGGVATVFEARQPNLGRTVAVKMLSHSLIHHPGFTEHFAKEARLSAQLNHENIVRVYDTESAWGTKFIVMEKLSGKMLADLIYEGARLSWDDVRRLLREICQGLHYSHAKGLLHRDVKPSNIFITDEGKVKLLDYGIAVEVENSAATTGRTFGTPHYMAPEQVRGHQLDGRSDLYAVGIVAYELITGDVPFDSEDTRDLLRMHLNATLPDPRYRVPDLPTDLVQFIYTCTAKSPGQRFEDCAAAAAYLDGTVETELPPGVRRARVTISYAADEQKLVDKALDKLFSRLRKSNRVQVDVQHEG